ncbi:methyltransferase domain-containing protein [bacterium]|nr:MAG: methyltransferase domain-containing protein [bacterium]
MRGRSVGRGFGVRSHARSARRRRRVRRGSLAVEAIVSLLWGKNTDVLRHYVAHRRRLVLMPAGFAGSDAASARPIQEAGGAVQVLEMLLPEGRIDEIRADAGRRAATVAHVVEQQQWPAFSAQLECEAERIRGLLTRKLEERLLPELVLVEALEVARRQHAIELVVVNEDVTSLGKTAALWARAHEIPVVHLAHSEILGELYTVHREFHADAMLAFGARGTEPYRDLGIEEQRLPVVGNPAWDRYEAFVAQRATVRREVYRHYGLNEQAPLVLFGTTWSARLSAQDICDLYERTVRAFLKAVRIIRDAGIGANVVIKDRPANAAFGKAALDAIAAETGIAPDAYRYATADTEALIVASDVVVSMDSNLSIEAMIAGVPALNYWDDRSWTLGPFFGADDGIVQATDSDLAAAVAGILTNPGFKEGVLAGMRAQRTRYDAGSGAAARVAETLARYARLPEQAHPDGQPAYPWQLLSMEQGTELHAGYIDQPRSELFPLFGHAPRCVLDVGCFTGATGAAIKQRYPGARVLGIELNHAAAQVAAGRIDRVFERKLEDLDFKAEGILPGSIDTVVLADVLEHLYDPWAAMLSLRPWLAPDAQVVASIPNTRNLLLLLGLAQGQWRYEPAGLLDVTHIRFFTKAEIVRFFHETGYEVTKMTAAPDVRLASVVGPPAGAAADVDLGKIVLKGVTHDELEELKTLQFLVLASPNGRAGNTNAEA